MPDFSVSVVGCQLRKITGSSSLSSSSSSSSGATMNSGALPAVLTSSSSSNSFPAVLTYEIFVKTGTAY